MTLSATPGTLPTPGSLQGPSLFRRAVHHFIALGLLLWLSLPASAGAQPWSAAFIPPCELPYGVSDSKNAAARPPPCEFPEPPSIPDRDAGFVAQSVPTSMVVGQPYAVSVRMRNDGEMTWTASQSFRLGSQNPGDNLAWGLHRVDVSGSVTTGQ